MNLLFFRLLALGLTLTAAVAAAWVPVIIAASLALTVLLYKEDG